MNPDTNYIRLRGLPFAAKESDVRDFLEGINAKSITFTLTSNGRASGECYVELDDLVAVRVARKLDRKEISGRYIEVFTVSESELAMMIRHGVLRRNGGEPDSRYVSNYVVRLRGLPYSANVDDVKEFFKGLDVADVVIDKEPGGRPSGEAFVRLATKQHAELALERSKNHMGTRYVEVFRSSGEEMENSAMVSRGGPPLMRGPIPLRGLSGGSGRFGGFAGDRFGYNKRPSVFYYYGPGSHLSESRYGGPMRGPLGPPRPSPYDRPYHEKDRYMRYDPLYDDLEYDAAAKVFMRGLPYNVTALDIEEFFKPLNCMEIKLGYNDEDRLSGDGIVLFSTMAEARDALSRNKKNIGSRYIELFPGTNIPCPLKFTTFRTIGGYSAMRGLSNSGYGRYSSFADGYFFNFLIVALVNV
uniref:RRM domain-containing protein n=1 Tax=Syphacia muris TaxID=451379 RepID=A0A0N5AV03_9BILA